MRSFQGIVASRGLTLGPAAVFHQGSAAVITMESVSDVEHERRRLEAALEKTREELEELKDQLRDRLGKDHATILDAQLLILEDEEFLDRVRAAIETDRLSAAAAFARAMSNALLPLDLSGDSLFRERMIDFRDVEKRVVRALNGETRTHFELQEPSIVVSSELTPSETASLDFEKILGFCIDGGSDSGHTAIIARSMGVPAVVGLDQFSSIIEPGSTLALDGNRGRVHLEPDVATRRRFQARMRRRQRAQERLARLRQVPAETRDGHRVRLSANIEVPEEIELAMRNGAAGIGLVRTEYFYFRSAHLPSENEQLEQYRDVLERAGDRRVTFRVLDVGGDKLLAAVGGVREYNPFLGLRGARFLLSNPGILQTQLRALYRTTAWGPMRIMIPMLCDLEELRSFQEHFALARRTLRERGDEFDENTPIGVMIETPSAVTLSRELAAECDFFSLGTNDLTQYVLAVDRTNLRVSHMAQPQHPAVLRAIAQVASAAREAGIPVGSCGDMGSNPIYAILLVGMGVDEISASASALPEVKKAIRTVSLEQAQKAAEIACAMSTRTEVDDYLRARAHSLLRDFLDGGP